MLIEMMNYQGQTGFVAEGRIVGRDGVVKEKVMASGGTCVSFLLNVSVCKMYDPNGKYADDGERPYSFNFHTINCRVYLSGDNSNNAQFEVARTLQAREHVVVFGRLYKTKFEDDDGEEVEYVEYRAESILFPERLASVLLDGRVNLGINQHPDFVPNPPRTQTGGEGKTKKNADTEREEDYPF